MLLFGLPGITPNPPVFADGNSVCRSELAGEGTEESQRKRWTQWAWVMECVLRVANFVDARFFVLRLQFMCCLTVMKGRELLRSSQLKNEEGIS